MCTQGSVKLTQHGVQALQAVVFFIGCELFSNQLFPVMDHFMKQMALFRREYTNGTNSVSIFLLSNILCMVSIDDKIRRTTALTENNTLKLNKISTNFFRNHFSDQRYLI